MAGGRRAGDEVQRWRLLVWRGRVDHETPGGEQEALGSGDCGGVGG